MSISTKEDFVKLVDKMLGIIYTDDGKNIKKIDSLIKEACGNIIKNSHTLTYKDTYSPKYSIHKILPCNNKNTIIDKNIILQKKNNRSGSSSSIYPGVIERKKFKYSAIPDNSNFKALFGYIFDYYLYNLINKPNYLCKTYEIGYSLDENDNTKSFYSIMDDCGNDIFSFFAVLKTENEKVENEKSMLLYKSTIPINGKNKNSLNILFNNLLIIFYKMILGVKIVHDLGYVHLDIKPHNFLISSNNGSNLLDLMFTTNIENIVLIKIIDFELIRKIGTNIITPVDGIGTEQYAHPDLIKDKQQKVVISPIHDIEMLRKSFIQIIGIIFLNSSNYKSKIIKNPDNFNEQISKILEELNKLNGDNKPDKLDNLLKILENIRKDDIYTNIDFLLNDFYCLLYDSPQINFTQKFKSTNSILTNSNLKTELSKKPSEFTIIPISDYYLLWYKKLLEINAKDISLKLYDKKNGKKILELNKYNEYNKSQQQIIKKSLTKYLLPIKDIITGYIIDEPTKKIRYFRKNSDKKYISLKTYFDKILSSKDENEYIKLTHVLYIFSLIMDCIQLFEYLLDYGLNVLLDNFIIHNDTTLFTLDIDLKIVGGIVNTKIDTRPIEILGNELFDILSKFSFFISDKVKIKNTNNIQTKLNKLINIKTKKEKSYTQSVKPKDIYRTELSEIIETMIFKSIDIMTLIEKFKEIRKTIYLNEILDKYEEISMSKKTEVKRIISTKINKEIFSRKINLDTAKYKEKDCTLERCMFGFLLYSYIYYFYKSQIKYLCEVAKITFKTDKKYYSSINNNCGTSLSEYFSNITVNSSNNKTIIFNNILKIFYEMLCCIEILHESGFLCVKPSENIFVIDNGANKLGNIKTHKFINDELSPPQKLLVKIVDFSSVRKIGFEIKDTNIFDSSTEKPNNWNKYSKKTIKMMSKFKLTPYHDIFLLGQLFKNILKSKNIEESVYEKLSFKTIIDKMCNTDPSKGYQDIDSLIIDFGYLLKTNTEKPKNKGNHIIKTEENYTIYYDGILLPYIKDTTDNKRYPITKDIIKKLAKNLASIELTEINKQKLKELLNRKYRNFNTLSKITRKKIGELNPKKKTFNNYANNLLKNSNLKKLLKNSRNNLNNVSNTDYIKYNTTDGKYKSATIKSILEQLKKKDIDKIVEGTFLEKVESNKNKPSADFGLENIFFILVRILFKKQKSESNNGKFYDSIYKQYRGKNEFILEIIYELLCKEFSTELTNSNITKLINNLKRINFLPYSFRYKQKEGNSTVNKNNISNLKEEDLFRKISPEKFQKGQNYFYEPNKKSILYFGKLENIEGRFSKTYIFKYYIGSDNLCDIIELSAAELQGLKFYEFNVTSQSNTKTLRRVDNESSWWRSMVSSFSSSKITCQVYDNSLPEINTYTDVENWVSTYCNNNNIKIANNITITPSRDNFTGNNFGDFDGTEIYDSGAGPGYDCLIRSLLFCMSESYRKLDEDGRDSTGSYFRRAFLPWFFDKHKQNLKNTNQLIIRDEIIYIRNDGINKKLNDLLCVKRGMLDDIIGDLLCHKLGINLLIFGPVMGFNKKTMQPKVINNRIQNYSPNFIDNNSNYTICICGNNTHFRSCNIKYKNDPLTFILEKSKEDVITSIKNIISIKNLESEKNCPFSFGETVIFDKKEYIILEPRHVPNQNGDRECDFYIVYNNTNNKNNIVVSILSHSDKIKKKQNVAKKSIDEILEIIQQKYPTIIINNKGKDITIPPQIINNLKKQNLISIKSNLGEKQGQVEKKESNRLALEAQQKAESNRLALEALVNKYTKSTKPKNLNVGNIKKIQNILKKINTKSNNYILLDKVLKRLIEKKTGNDKKIMLK